jgi:hypothetical protein
MRAARSPITARHRCATAAQLYNLCLLLLNLATESRHLFLELLDALAFRPGFRHD